jgi:hypothetical protein
MPPKKKLDGEGIQTNSGDGGGGGGAAKAPLEPPKLGLDGDDDIVTSSAAVSGGEEPPAPEKAPSAEGAGAKVKVVHPTPKSGATILYGTIDNCD